MAGGQQQAIKLHAAAAPKSINPFSKKWREKSRWSAAAARILLAFFIPPPPPLSLSLSRSLRKGPCMCIKMPRTAFNEHSSEQQVMLAALEAIKTHTTLHNNQQQSNIAWLHERCLLLSSWLYSRAFVRAATNFSAKTVKAPCDSCSTNHFC
jgi:hypothetical protein